MKKAINGIIFIILVLSGCNKQASQAAGRPQPEPVAVDTTQSQTNVKSTENGIDKTDTVIPQWITPETDVTNLYIETLKDLYFSSIAHDGRRVSESLQYVDAVLKCDATLYAVDGDETSKTVVMPEGTRVTILAQNNSRLDCHYLVLVPGLSTEKELWSGWIKAAAFATDIQAKVEDSKEQFTLTIRTNMATRGDFFVDEIGQMSKLIAVKKTGKIVCVITAEEMMRYFENAVGFQVLGWSSDNSKIWFTGIMERHTACFGVVDIQTKKYMLFAPPEYLSEIEVNFDTGDALYSKYGVRVITHNGRQRKESTNNFSLYKYNFYTREQELLDTSEGADFIITKNNGELSFEKASKQ
jgi:hypothetical protein